MKNLENKNVVITGAASGIGRCLAFRFAKEKSNLILTDINYDELMKVQGELEQLGHNIKSFRLDVSNKYDVDVVAEQVIDEFGSIDVLINNAGLGYACELAETSLEMWQKLMGVNFWGPLYHVYAFLPYMKNKEEGANIVNVSSGQAFYKFPNWGAYATSKLAVATFSEVLGHELRKYKISVSTVYPYMVNTSFYSDIMGDTKLGKFMMKMVPYYSMTPTKVAKIIVKAVKKNKFRETVSILSDFGFYMHFVPYLHRIFSRISNYFLNKRSTNES